MSKVKSARALFEKRIELNLEQNGDVQSKDFISVVGRTKPPGPRSLLASPRRRTIKKTASVAALPIAPTLTRTMQNESPPAHTKNLSPSTPQKRPELVTSMSCRKSVVSEEKWESSNNRESTNGTSETTSFSAWANELKIFENESLVEMLQGDGRNEDSRLLECLNAFDQSIRMANAKKMKAFNRRGSLVQEVLEEIDERLVEATRQTVRYQSQEQEPQPKRNLAATEDSVITLKPSSIRNNRRFTSPHCSNHSVHDNKCQSPGGGTSETCSTTSYETSASFESIFQTKIPVGNKNHRLLLKSYGYNKQRIPSPTSSVTSSVSKSSCGSPKSRISTCNPKSSPLVAPSPSTMERHSQVRNSVLKGLRPAPLIEQEDENQNFTPLVTNDTAEQKLLPSSSSLEVMEADYSSEERDEPRLALQLTGAAVPHSKAINANDEDCHKRYGGDSSNSLVSRVSGPFHAPGQNSSLEVNFGFGPMSPHRLVRPSVDLGFASCYIAQRALENPDSSQCCPDDILESQESMLELEDEKDESQDVKIRSGETFEIRMSNSSRQSQEKIKSDAVNPVDGTATFEMSTASEEPMDDTSPPIYISNKGGPADVTSIFLKNQAQNHDGNSPLSQSDSTCIPDPDTKETPVNLLDINVSDEKPSCIQCAMKQGYGEAKCSQTFEGPTKFAYKTTDESETPVDYGYGDTIHASEEREEAGRGLPPIRQLRRSLSFDGEKNHDNFGESALPSCPKIRGRRASLSNGSPSIQNEVSSVAMHNGSRRFSVVSPGGIGARLFRSQSRRMSTGNPFISQQLLSKPHKARSRVSPLELTMKKTEILARSMARRRGTLVHIAAGNGSKKAGEYPPKINDLIKFSLEELWKRRRRTPVEQEEIDRKANELFPKTRKKVARRVSTDTATNKAKAERLGQAMRRCSLDTIEEDCRLRVEFLEENTILGKKIFRIAATRIQARVRAYLHRSHYLVRLLERRWAKIEYEKIQDVHRVDRKLKSRKRVHKRKVLDAMKELAEQAIKARKLTDHLKSENNNIKDQNARLQQLCYKLRKINGHMEKTLKTHNKNFRSMWEFVEKMKMKKRRIEDKVKKYESRIELHHKNMDILQKRMDSEVKRKEGLMNTIRGIATTITTKSSNVKLKELVHIMADGKPMDEELLAEIEEEEEDIGDEEFDLGKSQDFDFLCETFHETFVSLDMEENDETDDEGFLLALSMDDNSTISDVSSIESDMEDSAEGLDFAPEGGDDGIVSVYEEILVDDEDESVGRPRMTDTDEGEIIEEIIEEVISDDEYIIEEVIVSSDEEDDDDDFSCQSSVYIDQGSIIM